MDREPGVALVVGATGGVGQRVAERLAGAGYAVALVGRDGERLDSACRTAARHGRRVEGFTADLAEPGAPARVVRLTRRRLGAVDVLVNAAGVFGPLEPLVRSDPREWVRTIQVNAVAPYRFARAVVGEMLERGHGRIVNVSSLAAVHAPTALNSAYATSKVALNQWTASLAVELDGTGVTANAIHPGEVKTRMWAAIERAARREGRAAEPFVRWADEVRRGGGDDPDLAASQILAIVDDPSAPNGMFYVVGTHGTRVDPAPAQGLTWARVAV